MTTQQSQRTDQGKEKKDPYMIITSDAHAGPPVERLRTYFEKKHWPAFDEYVKDRALQKAAARAELGRVYASDGPEAEEYTNDGNPRESLQPGGHPGLNDPSRRLRDMDADGVAGEVIFPDFPHVVSHEPPFGGVTNGRRVAGGYNQRTREFYDPELQMAGAKAYNRWLADFCSVAPERHAGIALTPFHNVEAAVEVIHWAKKAGLRGGILLPGMNPLLPGYNDPIYEPIWSACEDLEMPLNCHGGHEFQDYGPGPDGLLIAGAELMFFSHRPLWWFIGGGMFERHPKLTLVFAEQSSDWVPSTLNDLDRTFAMRAGRRGAVLERSLTPRGYWDRQCYIGATAMTVAENRLRYEIGVDTIMWGSDYPHPEGTWPFTKESLRHTFAGNSADEVRRMLGANAARAYHFDTEALAPIVQRVGPTVEEIAEPFTETPKDYIGQAFR